MNRKGNLGKSTMIITNHHSIPLRPFIYLYLYLLYLGAKYFLLRHYYSFILDVFLKMKVIIISEFELIKSYVRKVFLEVYGVQNVSVLLVHPNQLATLKNNTYASFPDVVFFDMDSLNYTPVQQYEIKKRIDNGDFFRWIGKSNVLLISTEQQLVTLPMKSCNVILKPFSFNTLKAFIKDYETLASMNKGGRFISGGIKNIEGYTL